MRAVAALVALCALSQTAVAQTPDCKTISDPGARLACFDRVNSATANGAAAKPASRAPAAPASARKVEPEKYIDPISAEDARMNAQLKNICRGC